MKHLESILLHSDKNEVDPHNAHITPIYNTSTYYFKNAENAEQTFSNQQESSTYMYNRFGTPTHSSLENIIVELEGYRLEKNIKLKAILHASGMGAISNLFFSATKHGDEVLTHYSIYGGTQEMLEKILDPLHIKTHFLDFTDLNIIEKTLKENPKITLIYMESPCNPTMECYDIKEITNLAKKYHVKVACDNTFNTAYIQQPISLGVDFVVYSSTKFLNGHGNLIGGIFIGKDYDFMKTTASKNMKLLGSCLSPFDAFLLSSGIKTLPLRMDRHSSNALQLARFLEQSQKVESINYPGLESNSSYVVAKKQMSKFGGMLSFKIKGDKKDAFKILNNLQMCKQAVSLGTLDTIVCHPSSSTHIGLSPQQKDTFGITENLIRVSVGLENIQDIHHDFENALKNM